MLKVELSETNKSNSSQSKRIGGNEIDMDAFPKTLSASYQKLGRVLGAPHL